MHNVKRLAAGAAAICALCNPALAQRSDLCTVADDGRFVLGFDIRPSLVVNADAVLDATRGALGLDGDAAERAFAFRRTIAAILASAGAPSGAAAQEAFVQGMIDSFAVPDEKALNPAAGIRMPLDDRGEAGELQAADMLDESSPTGMKPLALFNRFDLAPDNWSHCGEHRIVYGRERPNPNNPFDRFLLIFEAMVPNPDPDAGAAGCRRVAEFWGGLTGLDAAEQASRLSGSLLRRRHRPPRRRPGGRRRQPGAGGQLPQLRRRRRPRAGARQRLHGAALAAARVADPAHLRRGRPRARLRAGDGQGQPAGRALPRHPRLRHRRARRQRSRRGGEPARPVHPGPDRQHRPAAPERD